MYYHYESSLYFLFQQTEELQIVDLHNKLRAWVASGNETGGMDGPQPAASNMRKLEWNNDLAAVAQR